MQASKLDRHMTCTFLEAIACWCFKLILLCTSVTGATDFEYMPQGIDSGLIVKNAYARYNLSIGVGLSKVAGKVFRIGHLGNNDEIMIASAICGAEMSMLDAGMKIQPGSGIGAALKYWQETSSVIPTRAAP